MLETLKEVYNGKKVFLTGHTGFKGSWLLKMLHMLGADVKGYALAPETPDDHYCLINGDGLCTSVYGDLRNRQQLIDELVSWEPDFVFHLAAQPLVRHSYIIPVETFEVNAIGTANVLEGMRQLKKTCFGIFITTDKVYHNNESVYPYREHDKLGGHDPYSASKACAELVIDSYRNSFFNSKYYNEHRKAIAVARAGNVIGGGDWAKDRLLPDIARALGNNEIIKIRNPFAVRPWQHVLEPLCGYLQLGIKLYHDPQTYSEAFNFGPYAEDALSVEGMVKLAINNWEQGTYEIIQTPDQLHEAGLLKLDISKSIAKVNWRPKMNAEKAVATTVQWYKEFYLKKRLIADFTASQITTFLSER